MMHLLVFIFGFTGILGKLISLDAGPLVFWRVAIGAVAVAAWMAVAGRFRRLPRGMWWKAVGVGVVAAAHWLAFFGAIKLSTVSVALAVIATVPFFVGLIEPAVHRRPVDRRELALAGAVVVGLFLILRDAHAGQTATGPRLVAGACVALLAALLGGTFSVFNSVLVRHADSANLTRVELFSAAAVTGLFVAVQSGGEVASAFAVPAEDVLWLVLLGVVATAFAFLMGIEVMRQLSPFTCAMAINLEPVYSILLALWIFGGEERMGPGFYAGAAVLLGAVAWDAWMKRSVHTEKTGGDAVADHP